MEEQPTKVSLVGKKGNYFLIKFPNLKIPVSVNKNLYEKMRNSPLYEFMDVPEVTARVNSA
ncbi:hypothetical protein H7U19_15030 [Hyunsoonleella sp. SJ7]|uniref:Uncharacterized protein n=1 Tax=Hyunsoonleella aquatilis TaxID=2762758 RepID=A0A923KN40_9FLAO|nr:hypothetical protein [Hyunsoonleella aquatilis]MBC3759725.1 hypothetical protein [Hyunsoonleella aquatilis]